MGLSVFDVHENFLTGTIRTDFFSPDAYIDKPFALMVSFNVANNFLEGTLPFPVQQDVVGFNANSLRYLDFSNNMLSGTIPSRFIDGLAALELFYLNGNVFTGPIPTLSRLTSLRLLSLHSNNFTGTVPDGLSSLFLLRELNLSDNTLIGTIPQHIYEALTRLRSLDMHSNALSGVLHTVVGNLALLEELRLHDNMLTGSIPTELANLSSLRAMTLHGNGFEGAMPLDICNDLVSPVGDLELLTADCVDFVRCVCCHECY